MIELLLSIAVILLALIWFRLDKVSAVTASVGTHVGQYLAQMDERLQDIEQRLHDHFPTDEERQEKYDRQP